MALVLVASMVSSQSFGQVLGGSVGNPVVNPVESETTLETIQLAQSDWPGEIDLDPPVIDHEALETGTASEPQAFSALVVDDRGLERVTLFYRNRSGAEYQSVEMQNAAGTDEFTTSVATALGQTRVEYYIEALDTGGNRVLKGFPFFPLVRELTAATANVAQGKETSGPDSRIIYLVLGVVAVGAALALVGGSGGDDDGGGGEQNPDPTPGTVPLNIEVTPPVDTN